MDRARRGRRSGTYMFLLFIFERHVFADRPFIAFSCLQWKDLPKSIDHSPPSTFLPSFLAFSFPYSFPFRTLFSNEAHFLNDPSPSPLPVEVRPAREELIRERY